jgi:hypothetical protein
MSLNDPKSKIQASLTKLKHSYMTKKTFFIDRVTSHQHEIEKHFKIYYDELDKMREELLKSEYEQKKLILNYERDLETLQSFLQK